ncbi:MAG: type II toxin-antitoxin system PemK/MazF family toxin [Solirubrobacteraceae bacterium]
MLSPNEMNNSLNTVIVAPLTSTIKKYPTRIVTNINGKKVQIAIEQLKCIDKKSINNFIGELEIEAISEIKEVINTIFIL